MILSRFLLFFLLSFFEEKQFYFILQRTNVSVYIWINFGFPRYFYFSSMLLSLDSWIPILTNQHLKVKNLIAECKHIVPNGKNIFQGPVWKFERNDLVNYVIKQRLCAILMYIIPCYAMLQVIDDPKRVLAIDLFIPRANVSPPSYGNNAIMKMCPWERRIVYRCLVLDLFVFMKSCSEECFVSRCIPNLFLAMSILSWCKNKM